MSVLSNAMQRPEVARQFKETCGVDGEGGYPLPLLLAKLHRLRPAQKPIDRNVKPVCYLSQPVNVKRAEARVLKVDSAPAAKPNAGAELVVCRAGRM